MDDKSKFVQLKEEEREARKEILIDATLNLFRQKPFDEIGVRDIAAEVGISPASMYRYFPSREDLFMEAFIKDLQKIESWLEGIMERNESFSIEDFAEMLINHLLESEPTFQMMSFLMIKGMMSHELVQKFNAVQRGILKKIDTVLSNAGITEGHRLHSHVFYSSLNGIMMTFKNYPGRDKKEIEAHVKKLAKILCIIFRYGVASTLHSDLIKKDTNIPSY